MKLALFVAALLAIAAGFFAGLCDKTTAMWGGIVAGALLLLFANIEKVAQFAIGPKGLEARMHEVIAKAESATSEAKASIKQLQELAVALSTVTVSLLYREGRWGGGYSDKSRDVNVQKITSILVKLGISGLDMEAVNEDVHLCTEFDYSLLCLGSTGPVGGLEEDQKNRLKDMKSRGIDGEIATPEEIESFLRDTGGLTPESQELIEDYRHYKLYRNHRRPEVWAERSKIHRKHCSKSDKVRSV